MIDGMKMALQNVKTNLTMAQTWMKEYPERAMRSKMFCKETEVLQSTKNFRVDLHLASKLRKQWIGLYNVTVVISPLVYWLDLPPTWRIHPVFHIGNLKYYSQSAEFVRVERHFPPLRLRVRRSMKLRGYFGIKVRVLRASI